MKRLLILTLITTLYALIAFAGAWLAAGESVDCYEFSDTVRPSQACGVK